MFYSYGSGVGHRGSTDRQTDRPTNRQKPTIHFAHYGIVEAKREKRQQKKSKAKMPAVTEAKLTMK